MVAAFIGRVVIAALIIAGIYAFAKFINDKSKKENQHVR